MYISALDLPLVAKDKLIFDIKNISVKFLKIYICTVTTMIYTFNRTRKSCLIHGKNRVRLSLWMDS